MSSRFAFSTGVAGFALAAALQLVGSAAVAANVVLAESPEVVLTREDWDADLMRIPAERRNVFASSAQRVEQSLNTLLVNKTLAARAHAAGLDQDPLFARRVALAAERILAEEMLTKIENDAAKEFDSNPERIVARAHEYYLANGKRFEKPEQIEASHILISTEKQSPAAALATAKEIRAKLVAGADFKELATQLSDDRTAKNNGGHIAWFHRGATDPAFEEAAFALAKPGDLSEPVQSRFGYHVIRLDGRRPERKQSFDEVKKEIIADLRAKHLKEAREAAIIAIKSDSRLKVNQEAVEALVYNVPIPPNVLTMPSAIGSAPKASSTPAEAPTK
jgi:peptidyl-prolyl cis-trans isomerase C